MVLDKLIERTRAGTYKWTAIGGVGYTVTKKHKEWEIVLTYRDDIASMSFNSLSAISTSSFTFTYVADIGSKEYSDIKEIVDTVLDPIMAFIDDILMDEKHDTGTLTVCNRICNWLRYN